MTLPNQIRLTNAFANAFFGSIKNMARYPTNKPAPREFGYSDGAYFWDSINPSIYYAFFNLLRNNGADLSWQNRPIGGEIAVDDVTTSGSGGRPPVSGFQGVLFDTWPNTVGDNIEDTLNLTHPTLLFCHYFFQYAVPGSARWNNALRANKMMGYSFYLKEFKLTATAGKPKVQVHIENKGVAPIYADWQVEVRAIKAGVSTSLGFAQWNLSKILPGNANNYRTVTAASALADGTYTIVLKVINPLETPSLSKPLRFANTTQDAAGRTGWLTLGNMTIAGGAAN